MDSFQKYEAMRSEGSSPSQIYESGRRDGLDSITLIRMIRKICNLSIAEAKEVIMTADRPGSSLNDIQEGFIPEVERALASDPRQGNGTPFSGSSQPTQEEVH